MQLVPPDSIWESDTPMLNAALWYATQGKIPVFPLRPNTKFPLISKAEGGSGHLDATTDPIQITRWWLKEPQANIGAATGERSGFWVLDFDAYKLDELQMESACLRAPTVPEDIVWSVLATLAELLEVDAFVEVNCHVVRTPSGGIQVYYAWPSDPDKVIHSKKANPVQYVDTRGNGGYTVLPGSTVDGIPYELMIDDEIREAPPALLSMVISKPSPPLPPEVLAAQQSAWTSLPDDLLHDAQDAVDKRVKVILEDLFNLDEALPEWGESIWKAARDLVRIARTPGTTWSLDGLKELFQEACEQLAARDTRHDSPSRADRYWDSALRNVKDYEPLPRSISQQLTQTFGGGLTYDPKGPNEGVTDDRLSEDYPPRTWDDFGNADRVVDHYGPIIRYLSDVDGWAYFRSGEWEIGSFPLAYQVYRDTVEDLMDTEGHIYSNIPPADDEGSPTGPSDYERFMKFVNGLRTTARAKSAITAMQAKPEITARYADFDSDIFLFATKNGVLNLRTQEFRQPTAADMLTRKSSVNYDPNADCPKFIAYLETVLPDPEVRAFLQRWSGYCLTGDMRAQRFALHQGPPGTGKSVYLTVMHHLLGSYYSVAESNLFHSTNAALHPTGLAAIAGSRFIQASESESGRKLNEAMVNSVTTSEPITARKMHQNFFEFIPSGKLNYVTNHLPTTNPTSGVWRRMILIHWNQFIQHPNLNLTRELIDEEASGILNWALDGCKQWIETANLGVPLSSDLAKADYRDNEDILGQFLSTCTAAQPGNKVFSSDLYRSYQDWCRGAGVQDPKTLIAFGKAMKETGRYEGFRAAAGRGFIGLRIIEPSTNQPSNPNTPNTFGGHTL